MKTTLVVSGLLAVLLCGPGCGDSIENKNSSDGGSVTDGSGGKATLSMKQLIDGCIRASACGILTYPYLGNCLDAYLTLYSSQGVSAIYDRLYTCVNAAKGDCDAVAKCYRRGSACDSSYKPSCNGTMAVSCDLMEKRVFELDCALANFKCGVPTGSGVSGAVCTPGPCDNSYTTRCDGTLLLTCSNGVIEAEECADKGMGCGYYGWKTKSYACQGGSTTSCFTYGKNIYKPSCDNAIAVTCTHGKEHREDCSKHTYRKTGCSGGACAPAGTECTSNINRCASGKLEACLDGKWQQFDCAALGLGPCKPGSTLGANCSKPTP